MEAIHKMKSIYIFSYSYCEHCIEFLYFIFKWAFVEYFVYLLLFGLIFWFFGLFFFLMYLNIYLFLFKELMIVFGSLDYFCK